MLRASRPAFVFEIFYILGIQLEIADFNQTAINIQKYPSLFINLENLVIFLVFRPYGELVASAFNDLYFDFLLEEA